MRYRVWTLDPTCWAYCTSARMKFQVEIFCPAIRSNKFDNCLTYVPTGFCCRAISAIVSLLRYQYVFRVCSVRLLTVTCTALYPQQSSSLHVLLLLLPFSLSLKQNISKLPIFVDHWTDPNQNQTIFLVPCSLSGPRCWWRCHAPHASSVWPRRNGAAALTTTTMMAAAAAAGSPSPPSRSCAPWWAGGGPSRPTTTTGTAGTGTTRRSRRSPSQSSSRLTSE